MDRTMQTLALVALLLYLAPAALGPRLSDSQRTWLWRAAAGALAVGLAIAVIETIRWFAR
jgi:hypothetical protein